MSWEIKTIGEACKIEKGNIGITKAIAGDYPLVVLGEERKTHNEYQFDDEAVIIPLVSSTGHGDKSMKRIHYQSGKFSVGNILCAVIPKDKSVLLTQYLFRYLDLNKEKELVSRMKGMANVSLPMKSIAEVEIPIPPVELQREIVARLSALEESNSTLLEKQSHQLELLKKLRQQILQDALQGKLVPQDPNDEPASVLLKRIKAEKEKLVREKKIKIEKPLRPINPEEIPYEIPDNWVWCRLNDICESIVDCPHSTPKYLDYDTGFYGIDTNCINEKGEIVKLRPLSEDGYIERIRRLTPQKNDIVYSREGSIGLATLIPEVKRICLGQRVMLFRVSSQMRPLFVKFVVTEEEYKGRLLEKHRGMGAKHINVKDIVNSLVGLPPLEEQNRLVTKIEQLMTLFDELEQSLQQNQKYMQDLLQVALKEALKPKNIKLP